MHRQGRKRQINHSTNLRTRSHTLKVYLNTEDRIALQRIARENGNLRQLRRHPRDSTIPRHR